MDNLTDILQNRINYLSEFKRSSDELRFLIENRGENKKVDLNKLRKVKLEFLKTNLILQFQLYEEYFSDGLKLIINKIEDINTLFKNEKIDKFETSIKIDFLYQYERINTQLFYKSMILELYSFFETKLIEIAESLERKQILKYAAFAEANKGSYIDLPIKYLIKINELKSNPSPEIFTKIKDFRYIRNKLVHGNFNLDETNNYLIKVLEKNDSLNIDSGKIIINSENYIIDFLNTIIEFLTNLINNLILNTPHNKG